MVVVVCTYSEFFCSFAMDIECEDCGDLVSFRIDEYAAGKKRKLNWTSGLQCPLVSELIQADDRSEYTVSNTRCFVSETDTCASDEAFHEVPLGTSVQRCCRKFGSFRVTSLELSGEKADVKDAFSVMMGAAATLKVGNFRLPPKKESEIYQQNFREDWKLYSAVIDMLEAMNLGFKNGSEE